MHNLFLYAFFFPFPSYGDLMANSLICCSGCHSHALGFCVDLFPHDGHCSNPHENSIMKNDTLMSSWITMTHNGLKELKHKT